MKKLSIALCAAAVLAGGFAAGPALAQPAHVIVRGATPYYVPGGPEYTPDDGYWSNYGGFYGDPMSRYYDPAGVVWDWRYHGPKAIDVSLGRTLDRTGESMLGHMLTCQARHATYNPASNTYYGAHGAALNCED